MKGERRMWSTTRIAEGSQSHASDSAHLKRRGAARSHVERPIEVGAFSWTRIQRLHNPDATTHWQTCNAEGLQCPEQVFVQLFHDQSHTDDFAAIIRSIDFGRIHWTLEELTGIALRHVRVDRIHQHALDEARDHAIVYGIVDDREEVEARWQDVKTWLTPPVLIDADLLAGGAALQLLVGFTRLGSLLGMLDRQEVSEIQKHLLWVGRRVT